MMITKASNNNTNANANTKECCCCHVDDYNDMSRSWTKQTSCKSPYQCCNIPTKDECEVQLNPTFDGSCGHMHESKYQQQHNGQSSQVIHRAGTKYEMKGWLGQRLYDDKLNIVEEWCIDNGYADSFFLWRFVHCNGDYPNWFGRCVFPSATNSLLYKGCDENRFERTIPTCFGELEEMNIGLGEDAGHDVDYRYDVDNETLAVWCTNHTMPRDPLSHVQYKGKAPAENDGIVPFYLSQCRAAYNNLVSNNNNNNRLVRDYYAANSNHNPKPNNNNNHKREMRSLTFRVGIVLNKLGNNLFEVIVTGNNMPSGYESVIQYNDSISFDILNKQNISVNAVFLNSMTNKDWSYTISDRQYITFTYIAKEKEIILDQSTTVPLFIIRLNNVNDITNIQQAVHVGWIARANNRNGTFVGYGKLVL